MKNTKTQLPTAQQLSRNGWSLDKMKSTNDLMHTNHTLMQCHTHSRNICISNHRPIPLGDTVCMDHLNHGRAWSNKEMVPAFPLKQVTGEIVESQENHL